MKFFWIDNATVFHKLSGGYKIILQISSSQGTTARFTVEATPKRMPHLVSRLVNKFPRHEESMQALLLDLRKSSEFINNEENRWATEKAMNDAIQAQDEAADG